MQDDSAARDERRPAETTVTGGEEAEARSADPDPDYWTHRAQYTQARAWFEATHSRAEINDFSVQIDAAGVRDDLKGVSPFATVDGESSQLESDLVERWRRRSDEGMTPEMKRHVDMKMAEGWLSVTSTQQWEDWQVVRDLEVDPDHRSADENRLLDLWSTATRDDVTVQEALTKTSGHGETLAIERRMHEARLERAEGWLREHDASAYHQFKQRRSFADSVADERKDGRELISQYVDATGGRWQPTAETAQVQAELASSTGRLQALVGRVRDRVRAPQADHSAELQTEQVRGDDRGWDR